MFFFTSSLHSFLTTHWFLQRIYSDFSLSQVSNSGVAANQKYPYRLSLSSIHVLPSGYDQSLALDERSIEWRYSCFFGRVLLDMVTGLLEN